MEKALAPTTNNLPTNQQPVSFDELGLENWKPEDLIIPVLRIIQPTSQWDAPAGTFFDAQTGEIFETVNVVFVKSSWGRVKFKDDISEKGIECKSPDRNFPSVENPPAPQCKECPYSKWGADGQPPACKETLNNIIYLLPKESKSPLDGIPYLFSVHGMNLKPLKATLSSLITRGKPIYSRVIQMSLELTKNEKGKFYVVKYTPKEFLPPEIISEFARISKNYSRQVIDKSLEKAEEEWIEREEQTTAEEVSQEITQEQKAEEELKQEIIQKIRKEAKEKGLVEQAKQLLLTKYKKTKLEQLTLEELASFQVELFSTGWSKETSDIEF